ncbi:MAG: hypothetical protein JXQ93_13480, partial [Flavobacteriaceae bacterium]
TTSYFKRIVTSTSDGVACTGDSNVITVTVSSCVSPPTADAGDATANVCKVNTYTLAATATNGTIAWTANNGSGT